MMGALLHAAHAAARPAHEAQALEADAALFASMGQRKRPVIEPAAEVLGRLADQAERIKDAAVKLWPEDGDERVTAREHRLYGDVCELSARVQSMLMELRDIEAERGDEKNDPRSLGHYAHLKPAERMVAVAA